MLTTTKALASVLCALALTGCVKAPDTTALDAELAKPVQRYDNLLAIASNGRQLVSAGGGNALIGSRDGGKSWERVVLPVPAAIIAMSACPDGSFAALDLYRKVWIGDGASNAWEPKPVEFDFNPVAIHCAAGNRLWVVGSFSTILSSEDRGASWDEQPPGEDAILTAVQFVDAQHGFIAGEFGTLLTTVDGGASWTSRPGLPAEFYPYAMTFTDPMTGWVSGLAGAILHTSDGGESWQAQRNPSGVPMFALVSDGKQLLAAGASGTVLVLRGEEWQPVPAGARRTAFLAAAVPLADGRLLVAGAGGTLEVLPLPEASRRQEIAATEVLP